LLWTEVALSAVVGFVEAQDVVGGVVVEVEGEVNPVPPPPHHGHPVAGVEGVGAVVAVMVVRGLAPVVPVRDFRKRAISRDLWRLKELFFPF
jgi:hypothetical protein